MLDSLYENIGGKIKKWAKWTFIVEAIGSIITGIALGVEEQLCFLLCLIGPFVAWVSSWILYAFGQLVEDIHATREKYYPIAEEEAKRESEDTARREAEEKAKQDTEEELRRKPQAFSCPNCSATVHFGDALCPSCSQKFDWSNV